jgi:NAD-dependent SIR2 family protein deacetylase
LPEKDLRLVFENFRLCDLFMIVGSSLAVKPAAVILEEALAAGARLVIFK